jgi:hypothetical protein
MRKIIDMHWDLKPAQVVIKGLEDQSRNLYPVMKKFGLYMQKQIVGMFRKMGKGGTHRGVTWKWFSKGMYDSSRNPAGRKRHSGRRVTSGSVIMTDTGELKRSIMPIARRRSVQITAFAGHAAYMNKVRPFMFFTDDDYAQFTRLAYRHLRRKKLT